MDEKYTLKQKEFMIPPETWVRTNSCSLFICSLCSQMVDRPALLQCTHLFCVTCLEKYIVSHSQCPLGCANGIQMPIVENVQLSRIINSHQVTCWYPSCLLKNAWSKMKNHLQVCPFRAQVCLLCLESIEYKDCKVHVFDLPINNRLCPGVVKCPRDCDFEREIIDNQQRRKETIKGIILKERMFQHSEIECEKLILVCPYCFTKVARYRWQEHMLTVNEHTREHLKSLFLENQSYQLEIQKWKQKVPRIDALD